METRPKAKTHEDWEVYRLAFDAAMQIFEMSKQFPVEERYSLSDRIRRSSRSVCANLAQAWLKQRYKAAFIAKLSDCEAEASETQVCLKFAIKCEYIEVERARDLYGTYNTILGSLVKMINDPENWLL